MVALGLVVATACRTPSDARSAGSAVPSRSGGSQQGTKSSAADSTKADASLTGRASGAEGRGAAGLSSVCAPSAGACHARGEELLDANPEAGEALLNACLSCDDVGPATYRLLATVRIDRGAEDRARELLQSGVRRFPQSVLLWQGLGRLELSMGRQREGLSAIGAAHRLNPDDEALSEEYRDLLARYGTEEDRLEAIVHPLLLEAVGRFEIDDAEGALEVLATALKKADKSPRLRALVRSRLASVLVSLRRYDEARKHLALALRDAPTPSSLRAELLVTDSEVRLAGGDVQGAIQAASEAVAIEPKNPLAHANLGVSRAIAGNVSGAIDALYRAVDCGLGRRLTKEQFLGIGPPLEKLKALPDFQRLLEHGWPSRPTSRPSP